MIRVSAVLVHVSPSLCRACPGRSLVNSVGAVLKLRVAAVFLRVRPCSCRVATGVMVVERPQKSMDRPGTALSIRSYMGLGHKNGDDLRKAMTFKKMI